MTTIAEAVIAPTPGASHSAGPGPDLEPVAAGGQTSFRVPIRWAEVEPAEGRYDDQIFERAEEACRSAQARGLEPVAVVHSVDLPEWLGPDFWLRLEAPVRFRSWAAAVVDRLGNSCRRWVTLAEPNAVAWEAWITGTLPPHRVGAVGDLVRCLDHMLTAHVLAHAEVHAHHPGATARPELRPMPVYELDGLLTDVLTARADGADRYDLRRWLGARRAGWYRRRPTPPVAARALEHLARSAIPLEQALPRAVAAVYDGPYERPVD